MAEPGGGGEKPEKGRGSCQDCPGLKTGHSFNFIERYQDEISENFQSREGYLLIKNLYYKFSFLLSLRNRRHFTKNPQHSFQKKERRQAGWVVGD